MWSLASTKELAFHMTLFGAGGCHYRKTEGKLRRPLKADKIKVMTLRQNTMPALLFPLIHFGKIFFHLEG